MQRISKRQMRGCSFEKLIFKANEFLNRSKELSTDEKKNSRALIEACIEDFIDALEMNIEKFQIIKEDDPTYIDFINRHVFKRAGVANYASELKKLTTYRVQIERAKAAITIDPQSLVHVVSALYEVPDSVSDVEKYINKLVPDGIPLVCSFPINQFKRSKEIRAIVEIWKVLGEQVICVNPSLLANIEFCAQYGRSLSKIENKLQENIKVLQEHERLLHRRIDRKLRRARHKLSSAELSEIRRKALISGFTLLFKSELERLTFIDLRRSQLVAFRRERKEFLEECSGRAKTVQLPWEFFPQGKWDVDSVLNTFTKTFKPKERLDPSRIRKIKDNLDPSICYVGTEGFNRYIAFSFDWTQKVVLECPIYGNAIYVISGDWKKITMHSKWEARRRKEVKVIRHDSNWFSRLKSALR